MPMHNHALSLNCVTVNVCGGVLRPSHNSWVLVVGFFVVRESSMFLLSRKMHQRSRCLLGVFWLTLDAVFILFSVWYPAMTRIGVS